MEKKNYLIIIVVVLALIGVFIWWNGMRVGEPATETPQTVDTTETIQQELDAIDIGNVDAEFNDVDAALQNL